MAFNWHHGDVANGSDGCWQKIESAVLQNAVHWTRSDCDSLSHWAYQMWSCFGLAMGLQWFSKKVRFSIFCPQQNSQNKAILDSNDQDLRPQSFNRGHGDENGTFLLLFIGVWIIWREVWFNNLCSGFDGIAAEVNSLALPMATIMVTIL